MNREETYIQNVQNVIQTLKVSDMPLSIEAVKFRSKMSSWGTTRSILLELLVNGKIRGLKSSNGWIFWSLQLQPLPKEE